MKPLILIAIIFALAVQPPSEKITELNPTLGKLIDKSPEGEANFVKRLKLCEALWAKTSKGNYGKLSKSERNQLKNCPEDEDYWGILGSGCNWYCGGGLETASASSSLSKQGNVTYIAKNANDLNYKTAWIEGVSGYGIGEYLIYDFPPENPRITKIIVVNGYVKSEKAWNENSRVKQLKVYLDERPLLLLNLQDTRKEQIFTLKQLIGNGNRTNYKALQLKPRWKLKFEITDVYKGQKFDDTAITEIYFDGTDVH
ncbi:NADase-type glycan-binding domain-containing protein [Pedobacter helvus]|uniref:NADase-type glycan-binding domain-containing protein n=1 Tax=Pedobacter helvus TaxID=2563444 RepID=A0ABW9JKZ9_9SPHI|nr:hypothetical protein [Pedobacter ureilyticus]